MVPVFSEGKQLAMKFDTGGSHNTFQVHLEESFFFRFAIARTCKPILLKHVSSRSAGYFCEVRSTDQDTISHCSEWNGPNLLNKSWLAAVKPSVVQVSQFLFAIQLEELLQHTQTNLRGTTPEITKI